MAPFPFLAARRWLCALLFGLVIVPGIVYADREASNQAHVVASKWGAYYAKSVPAGYEGTAGFTLIYKVEDAETDRILHRYPWYASHLELQGFTADDEVRLVRFGQWPRGSEASRHQMALAFYKDGELLKSYSTLDIAGTPDNVQASVSHYRVFGNVGGFRRAFGNQMVFDVDDIRGNTLTFDADTGDLLSPEDEALQAELDELRNAYRALRATWYAEHRDSMSEAHRYPIDLDALAALEGVVLPVIPVGYSYRTGSVWEPSIIEQD